MLLYHTGFDEIPVPDLRRGRINADFGQGFYLSDDPAFAERWATEKKDAQTFVNRYELHTDDLQIKRFERDEDWFQYIFSNRRRMPDTLKDFDVIIGPIANDPLFNTFGVLTSGMLDDAVAMALLQLGPAYTQVVLKTERAKAALRFLGAATLGHDTLKENKTRLAAEEAAFQSLFSETMQRLLGDTEDGT